MKILHLPITWLVVVLYQQKKDFFRIFWKLRSLVTFIKVLFQFLVEKYGTIFIKMVPVFFLLDSHQKSVIAFMQEKWVRNFKLWNRRFDFKVLNAVHCIVSSHLQKAIEIISICGDEIQATTMIVRTVIFVLCSVSSRQGSKSFDKSGQNAKTFICRRRKKQNMGQGIAWTDKEFSALARA